MSDLQAKSKLDGVRSLQRGLEILRHVNASGGAKPSEIAKAVGLPRPTVYRLLQTLEETGYIAMSASSNLVRVTRLAGSLGDSAQRNSEICRVGAPLLTKYAGKLVWPLDLSIYDNTNMVIQETTHGRSPLSIDRAMTGFRMPVLRTSAGRAYLAFCTDAERTPIVNHLRRLGDPADLFFLENGWLERMIKETRERGYALRDFGEFRAQTASIAVPVISDGINVASISMIWIRSAMKTSEAAALGLKPLKELAAAIGDALSSAAPQSLDTPLQRI